MWLQCHHRFDYLSGLTQASATVQNTYRGGKYFMGTAAQQETLAHFWVGESHLEAVVLAYE